MTLAIYNRALTGLFIAATAAFASGGKTGGAAGTPGEIRILNEIQPAGGTVQLKFSLTRPIPIMTGTSGFQVGADFFSEVDGIALFSATGDVFGTALMHNGFLRLAFVSPGASFGTSADYPIFTVAAKIRADAPQGQTVNVALDPGSYWVDPATGQASQFLPKPGAIKVGGSVSISNVVPGGGTWKSGTVIRLLGMGFQAKTTVRVDGPAISAVRLVSPTEIDLTLGEDATMDGKMIIVTNPDGSSDTYYSYLRGVPQGQSNVLLLAQAVPVFSTTTHSQASIAQQGGGLLTALAIQNSNGDTLTVQMQASDNVGNPLGSASISLPFGARITRELGEYFGIVLPAGSVVSVKASGPVQMLGMSGDPNAWTVAPLSPVF